MKYKQRNWTMNLTTHCVLVSLSLAVLVSCGVHCDNRSTEPHHLMNNSSDIPGSTAVEKVLSRKKRYLTFPTGSSVQLIFCLTIPILAPYSYAFGYTVSLAYPLPDDTRLFFKDKEHGSEMKHRRDRRDLYPRIETFLKSHGMDGRECVLRALCESGQRKGTKGEFFEELLHAIFTFPTEGSDLELDRPIHYDNAHRADENCTLLFPDCSQSLFDLVLQ